MPIEELIEKLEAGSTNVRFNYLVSVCSEHFGEPRIKGSHHIFKTPWPGDPRLNLQTEKGKAKPYQVRQVVSALRKLNEQKGNR